MLWGHVAQTIPSEVFSAVALVSAQYIIVILKAKINQTISLNFGSLKYTVV